MVSTRKAETRTRLLDVARKLFQTHGFHGVGLEDIAAEAGISRQAIYKSHFSSKADLVLELTKHVHEVEKLEELIQPTREASDGPEALRRTIHAIVQIQMKLHDLSMVLNAAARTDADAKTAWEETMQGQRSGIRRAIERVESESRLNPNWKVETAVDMVAMLLSTDSYQHLVCERGWTPEEFIARVSTLCESSLLVCSAYSDDRLR